MPLVTLDQAKDACNIDPADTTKDPKLSSLIDAASEYVEFAVGRIEVATRTVTRDGGRRAVLLPDAATSITTVKVGGTATTDYTPDLGAGIVYCGGGSSSFPSGIANVEVTYVTGLADMPATITEATLALVQHWFQFGQQGQRPAFGGDQPTEQAWTPSGFAVPKRVAELLEPFAANRMPGIA